MPEENTKKRIGLITQSNLINFGSDLQAYSLFKYLQELGFDVEIIDYWIKDLLDIYNRKYVPVKLEAKAPLRIARNIVTFFNSKNYDKMKNAFADFRKDWIFSRQRYVGEEEIEKNPPKYDFYVTGSDCIWHPEYLVPARALHFAKNINSPKISYAPSVSFSGEISREKKEYMKGLLSNIDFLSCREKAGSEFLQNLLKRDVQTVLDPVFLHDKNWWADIAGEEPIIEGDYIFSYVIHPDKNIKNIIRRLRKIFNLPVVLAVFDLKTAFLLPHDKVVKSIGPKEFLNLVYHCKRSVVSSFHGAAFSAIFKKDCYFIRHSPTDTRTPDLHSRLGIKNKIIYDIGGINTEETDYSQTDALLARELASSEKYLKNALGIKDV